MEKYGRARQATDDNIIRRMRFACWITKATDSRPDYLILIVFPRQQWFRERASMLRLYAHCLPNLYSIYTSCILWRYTRVICNTCKYISP